MTECAHCSHSILWSSMSWQDRGYILFAGNQDDQWNFCSQQCIVNFISDSELHHYSDNDSENDDGPNENSEDEGEGNILSDED